MINVNMDKLNLFGLYDQIELAELWGYKSYHAIRRGILTPAKTNKIILFITHEKVSYATPYDDKLEDNIINIDGEEKHGNDKRLIDNFKGKKHDDIYLFYRNKYHEKYVYYGLVKLINFELNKIEASRFSFQLIAVEDANEINDIEANYVFESNKFNELDVDENEEDYNVNPYPNRKGKSNKKYIPKPSVGKKAIKSADFGCVLDREHMSFISKATKKNYVEPHHLIPVSNVYTFWDLQKINIDCIANITPLCPVCHKKVHLATDNIRKDVIMKLYEMKKDDMKRIGLNISLQQLLKLYGFN